MVDGVIYFSTPDNVYAVDARSGHQIWHYTYPPNKGFQYRVARRIDVRRMALLHDADARLISLNAKDGTVRWNVAVADSARRILDHDCRPLIVRNHVLVGVSGDFDNLTGFLKSVDPETARDAVALGQHSAERHAERNHRGHDVDDRHLRPRHRHRLLGHRQPDSGAERRGSPRQ